MNTSGKITHFNEYNLEPDNEITYSSFVYNKFREYLNTT